MGLLGPKMEKGWVKNGKKKIFSLPATFLPIQFCQKMKFLLAIVSQHLKQTKI